MKRGEETTVCSLIEKVFNEFVAPDYGPEGIEEFFKFANPYSLAQRAGPDQMVVVAEHESEVIGVIEVIRYDHISMLFVDNRGQGIAKNLVRFAVEKCLRRQPELKEITVNSSPFAEPVYRRMGFKATGPLQQKNGITFVPMVCALG